LLYLGGQGIVESDTFIYEEFNLPLGLIGIFCCCDRYVYARNVFQLQAARKDRIG
jgi:hypothetical protein